MFRASKGWNVSFHKTLLNYHSHENQLLTQNLQTVAAYASRNCNRRTGTPVSTREHNSQQQHRYYRNSSTSLTVTYNGSTSGVTVSFLSSGKLGDVWKVTFPSTVSFASVDNTGVIALWVEPEDSIQVNAGFFHPSSNVAFFFSDDSVDTNPTAVPNGPTVTDIGTDTSNGGSISATFNDNGDVARALDAGSTVGLLFLALTALFSASRLRHFQLG